MAKLLENHEINDYEVEDEEILIFRGLEPNPETINREQFEQWLETTRLVPLVRTWDGDIVLMHIEDFYLNPSLVIPALKQYRRPVPSIFLQNKFSKFQKSSL
jgi:hypothetical protein